MSRAAAKSFRKGKAAKKKGHGITNKFLTAIAILGLVYTVAMFLEVTSATNKSFHEELLNHQMYLGKFGLVDTSGTSAGPLSSETSTPPRISNSHLVTWVLTSRLGGKDKDKNSMHSAYNKLKDSPSVPLEFAPGSLHLSHAETLKYCFTDPAVYKGHFMGHRGDGSDVPVSYSDKYKLAYVMLPKSGSSTARQMLKDHFDAVETKKSLQQIDFNAGGKMEEVQVITFVRDPLSRFFSQYEEAYVRTAPWTRSKPHPYPYLFENINNYEEYQDIFCPPETRSIPESGKECVDKPSAENGTLASRLERFVNEYDGRNPFDVHLTLQVPMLSSENGIPLHMTQIYNTTDADNAWRNIGKQFIGANSTLSNSGAIEGRSYPRRLKKELVSIETQRKICELALLDYCCLNLPLPSVCQGEHYRDENGVVRGLFCKLEARAGRGSERIQPGIIVPPHK